MLSNPWTHSRRYLVPLLALPLMAAPVAVLPATAVAETTTATQQSSVAVRGADEFSLGGDSFECATVSGLGANTLYADVVVAGKTLTKDMTYTFDSASDTFGIVKLDAKTSYVAAHSGDMTLNFYNAKTSERAEDETPLLSATVYAVCIQVDGKAVDSVANSMIAIRTASAANATDAIEAPAQIVRDGVTYQLVGSGKVTPTLKDGVLYVSYKKVDDAQGVSASVLYVDESGNTIQKDSYTLATDEQKTVDLRKSIEANDTVYKPLTKVSQVKLSANASEQRVYCVARAKADTSTKDVTISYVSTTGKQLMVDRVAVGAGGFLYAPATSFSQAHDTAVSRYVLAGAVDESGKTYTAKEAAELKLTRDGAASYTLKYEPEETELTYTVNFALVSAGKAGNTQVNIYKSETAKVTSTADASVALPATLEVDGVTYKRSGSDTSMTYEWADLSAGRLLTDTVYYVSDDVETPAAYEVEVRYVDAVSGAQIGSKTLTCEPDGTGLSVTAPESVTYEGNEYERLDGQSAPITHHFYAPYRTYTVYYALPGSMSAGDTTVTRTVVVDGGVRYYTIDSDGTVENANTNGTSANTAGGLVATVPYTSVPTQATNNAADADTDADSNADQTGDATAPNGESAYEERIADNETPLASGTKSEKSQQTNVGLIATAVAAVAALLAVVLAWRKKRTTSDASNSTKEA